MYGHNSRPSDFSLIGIFDLTSRMCFDGCSTHVRVKTALYFIINFVNHMTPFCHVMVRLNFSRDGSVEVDHVAL